MWIFYHDVVPSATIDATHVTMVLWLLWGASTFWLCKMHEEKVLKGS